jgi:hypothetical protein
MPFLLAQLANSSQRHTLCLQMGELPMSSPGKNSADLWYDEAQRNINKPPYLPNDAEWNSTPPEGKAEIKQLVQWYENEAADKPGLEEWKGMSWKERSAARAQILAKYNRNEVKNSEPSDEKKSEHSDRGPSEMPNDDMSYSDEDTGPNDSDEKNAGNVSEARIRNTGPSSIPDNNRTWNPASPPPDSGTGPETGPEPEPDEHSSPGGE